MNRYGDDDKMSHEDIEAMKVSLGLDSKVITGPGRYRTRSGAIAVVSRINHPWPYSFWGHIERIGAPRVTASWAVSGRWRADTAHDYDIVSAEP